MISFEFTLSKKIRDGQSEIKAKCRISHTTEFRTSTNVWVLPEIFIAETGEIYTDNKKLKELEIKGRKELSNFQDTVSNIVKVTENAIIKRDRYILGYIQQVKEKRTAKNVSGVMSFDNRDNFTGLEYRDWINNVLRLQDRIDLSKASFYDVKDGLRELEVEEKRLLSKRSAKTLFDYILQYPEVKETSPKRAVYFKVLARSLYRYQLYRQTIEKDVNFVVDYDTLTPMDVERYKVFLHEETKIVEEHSKPYKKIIEKTNNRFPTRVWSIGKRSSNYLVDILNRLKSVFNWLNQMEITTNNPVKKITLKQIRYGIPIFITQTERDELAMADLSEHPNLELYRDVFILQLYTYTRYGDLSRFTYDNITEYKGRLILEYMPNKTRKSSESDLLQIPIVDEIPLKILEKYKGVDPSGRLLPFPSLSTMNNRLKEIFTMCGITRKVPTKDPDTGLEVMRPLNEVISTHKARISGVNNAYQECQDPEQVKRLSGHKTNKAFSRYRTIPIEMLIDLVERANKK